MNKHLVAVVLISVWFAQGGRAPGQDSSASKNTRMAYEVKYAEAKILADILGKHFKGEPAFQVLADPQSNFLLVSGPAHVLPEVAKLLEQLDRRPHVVSVELLIAEITLKKGAGGKFVPADEEINEKELNGPSQKVLEKIDGLTKKGAIGGLKRIHLTVVEHQPTTAQIGEIKPRVTATVNTTDVDGRPRLLRMLDYRNAGAEVRLTVRVVDGKTVMMDLNLSESRLHIPEDGIPIGKDEAGTPIRATELIMTSLKANLSIPSGLAVAATGVQTDPKTGRAQFLVIVTARILELDGPRSK
jgi:hypothetical protein